MNELIRYGADARRYEEAAACGGTLARVVSQSMNLYRLAADEGEFLAEVSGRFRYAAESPADYPAAGDFVAAELPAQGGAHALIHRVLPRRSAFYRTVSGTRHDAQVVATNIDTVFVCVALTENFRESRLERYLSAAWSSGATPVLVLTKADLCPNLTEKLLAAEAAAPGVELLVTQSDLPATADALKARIGPGKTASLIGSSGVGKSTLINLLLGQEQLSTGDVRADGKGRHTTTRRELLLLPDGGVVIDTPGMRELELAEGGADLSRAFPDVDALAAQCRFADCAHESEPGCAVRRAVESGALDARRLESYKKLLRETRYEGLSGKRLENEKANAMFKDVGGMKKMRAYIRQTNKRTGE